jgi:hypothetical protein
MYLPQSLLPVCSRVRALHGPMWVCVTNKSLFIIATIVYLAIYARFPQYRADILDTQVTNHNFHVPKYPYAYTQYVAIRSVDIHI